MAKYNAFINFNIKNLIFKLNYYKNDHIGALITIKTIKQCIIKAITKAK